MNPPSRSLSAVRAMVRQNSRHWLVFAAIFLLGIFARTWEFGRVPPGLNADEASNGVDAFSIYRYGTDRNGVSYPVKFVSWGGGQDALYGYLLVPFVALLGLTPSVVRLPMLITGILSLPLIYFVARNTVDAGFGLLSMLFIAISPWHILASRWGLEVNFFPFLFLAAYACVLLVTKKASWWIGACVLFGMSLYSYGTAYAVVPVFLIGASAILLKNSLLRWRQLLGGLMAFFIIGAPVAALVLVNTFKLSSISLGPITIPRFPVRARYETETLLAARDPVRAAAANLWSGLALLTTQSDGQPYNGVDPYGYFYLITFPVALVGVGLLLAGVVARTRLHANLVLVWMAAAIVVPLFEYANINRVNIIFIPLILCVAITVYWLGHHHKFALPISITALLFGFLSFTIVYHGPGYRQLASPIFHNGLLPALRFADTINDASICVDDNNMPYIFVLFVDKMAPTAYLNDIRYVDPQAFNREVISFGRYTFDRHNCADEPPPTYILLAGKKPPRLGSQYRVQFFDDYAVYYETH